MDKYIKVIKDAKMKVVIHDNDIAWGIINAQCFKPTYCNTVWQPALPADWDKLEHSLTELEEAYNTWNENAETLKQDRVKDIKEGKYIHKDPPKCTCEINVLMSVGCKCGGT